MTIGREIHICLLHTVGEKYNILNNLWLTLVKWHKKSIEFKNNILKLKFKSWVKNKGYNV